MLNIKIIILLLFCTLLPNCTTPTKYERNPAGIGYGTDDMKMSPCAITKNCIVFYKNGKFKKEK